MRLAPLLEIASDDLSQVLQLQAELIDLDRGFDCELGKRGPHPLVDKYPNFYSGNKFIDIKIIREGTDFKLDFLKVPCHYPKWIANWFCIHHFLHVAKSTPKLKGTRFKISNDKIGCGPDGQASILFSAKQFTMRGGFLTISFCLRIDDNQTLSLDQGNGGSYRGLSSVIDFMRPNEIVNEVERMFTDFRKM